MQDRSPPARQNPLATHGRTIHAGQNRKSRPCGGMSALPLIVLQNSKVAAVQIFGENLKRKEVDDSHSFSRATEVAHEFGARR